MPEAVFYHSVRLASRPLFRLYFSLRREGEDGVPRQGPVLLAANHVSYLDPAVLGSVVPRQVHFLMDRATWAHPSLNWFYRGMQAIPVDRDGGPTRDAFRAALAQLKLGNAVAIFPEGQRSPSGRIETAELGVALIARLAGAVVVPVGIGGTERSMPRGKGCPEPARVRVLFGTSFRHADVAAEVGGSRRDVDVAFTERLMSGIAQLAELARGDA